MHWMYPFEGGWMMVLWWLILFAIILLVTKWSRQKIQFPKDDSAIEILKKRYARGEISKEEFEEKKRDLV